MASPLKTLVLRLPSRTAASITTQCCPRASMSTSAVSAAASRPARIPQKHVSVFQSQPQPSRPSTRVALVRCHSSLTSAASFKAGTASGAKRTMATVSEAQTATASTPPPSGSTPLDWNTFFKLRTRRRRIQVVFSVASGFLGFFAGMGVLTTGVAEPLVSQVPLDPIVTMGLMTFACGGVGWLVGPSIGSQLFYLMNRQFTRQIHQKEAEFFARIKKHRVDPRNSSAANPGE